MIFLLIPLRQQEGFLEKYIILDRVRVPHKWQTNCQSYLTRSQPAVRLQLAASHATLLLEANYQYLSPDNQTPSVAAAHPAGRERLGLRPLPWP